MRFTEGDAPVDQLRCARDDEQRLTVLLDLGMLMCLAGFLDGDIFDAASAGINARGNGAGFAVAGRRCRWVCSDVHSFPSVVRCSDWRSIHLSRCSVDYLAPPVLQERAAS